MVLWHSARHADLQPSLNKLAIAGSVILTTLAPLPFVPSPIPNLSLWIAATDKACSVDHLLHKNAVNSAESICTLRAS